MIGLDLDGVIIDHAAQKIIAAKRLGLELLPEETPSDIIKSIFPADALNKLKFLLYENPETALRAPLMAGAKDALLFMKECGQPFVLISRRKNPKIAEELLRVHGVWPKLLNEENAFFVKEPEEKNEQAKILGVTHYVDDEISILEKLRDVRHKFLFDSTRALTEETPFVKVSSWEELRQMIL